MKIIKFLLLGLGLYILYFTVKTIGWQTIAGHIMDIKWQLFPVLLVYPFIFAFDTLGWASAFPRRLPSQVRFRDLYSIRIIGETFNCLIPWAASLGGEPLKAELLKRKYGVSMSEGMASILIVHTTFWVALNLFVVGGIVATLKTLPLTPVLWQSVIAFIVGLGLVAVLLIIGLHLGIFKKVHALGETFKWWGPYSMEKGLKFLELDGEIKKFYGKDPRRFFLSVFFNFLGWFAGTFEVYLIARILGMPVGLAEAWLLEALIQVLRIVTFFIPSSIGAQEGGIVLIFSQFGYANPVSLTFAVIRRIREVIWLSIGLVLWALIEDKPVIRRVSE